MRRDRSCNHGDRCRKVDLLRALFVLAAVSGITALLAAPVLVYASCDGVTLPPQVEALGLKLVQNGMGTRHATFMKIRVMVAALYVEQRTRRAADVLQPGRSKALQMHFLRDVSRAQYVAGMTDSLKEAAGKSFGNIEPQVKKLGALIPDLPRGSVLMLAYHPAHGLQVTFNGKVRGMLKESHQEIGSMMFANMIGANAADEALRANLLGTPCDP